MIGKFSLKTGLVRNILTLFTGSTIAQAIPVLISPILTRLYPVSDFATLTVVATLISLIGAIVTGRYEVGVGLPASDREARQLVFLSLIISIFVSVTTFVVLLFGKEIIAGWLNNPDAANYLLYVPAASLFYGFYQALSYWNIRKRHYGDLAASRISQSVVNSGLSLGFAFTGWGLNGLVLGNVGGHLSAFAYTLMRIVSKKELTTHDNELDKVELRTLAKKYSDLPKVNGVHALTDMAQSTLVIFIISAFFGTIVTGLYGLTIRILQAPLNMIGSSFSIVFYKEVSEKISKQQKVVKLLRTTITTLVLISFPVFAIIMIGGPAIFEFVFGADWREAGVYARIMSPWLFLNFISSPISHLPVIMNKQRQFFAYSLLGNTAVIISLALGAIIFSEMVYTLMVVVMAQVIFQSSMIFYFIHLSRKADQASNAT